MIVASSPDFGFSWTDSGESATAQYVSDQARKSREQLEGSHTFGAALQVKEELCRVAEECSQPDWDGYGAQPASSEAYRNAYLFLEAIPRSTPLPTIGAEPDGHFTLEWHHGPKRTFSVSVSPDGKLHYAALIGPNTTFGTEAFVDGVPKTILDLIRKVSVRE